MTERPLLLRGPQVRAFLEGRQTQDRRPMVPQPGKYVGSTFEPAEPKGNISFEHHWAPLDFERDSENKDEWWCFADGWAAVKNWRCPFGQEGDHLWVRETWGSVFADEDGIALQWRDVPKKYRTKGNLCGDLFYRADPEYCDDPEYNGCWVPSIHMPRWASRLTLEIERVRVEQVQSISEDDAKAEAVLPRNTPIGPLYKPAFCELWDSIYAKTHPWASNPWVWVLNLKVVK